MSKYTILGLLVGLIAIGVLAAGSTITRAAPAARSAPPPPGGAPIGHHAPAGLLPGAPPAILVAPVVTASCTLTDSITTTDVLHSQTVNGLSVPSLCATNTCPGLAGCCGAWYSDIYYYTNNLSTPQCITITINSSGCGGEALFSAAYQDYFDPNNPCYDYLGDAGFQGISGSGSYKVTVPAHATFVVDVENYDSGRTCASYTLTVTGDIVGPGCGGRHSPTPTRTPGPTRTPTATITPGGPTLTPTCPTSPTPGPWQPVAPMPTASDGSSATSDGTYAYVAGGYQEGSYFLDRFARYVPGANLWTVLAPLPQPVAGPSLIYAPNTGKIYAFGGDEGYGPLNTTAIYNLTSGIWTAGAPMPDARELMAVGYDNGKIYLAGGFGPGNTTADTLWAYDPLTDMWDSSLPGLPAPVAAPGYGVIASHLYIAGGWNGAQALATTYDYDIGAQSWNSAAPLPNAVYAPGSAVVDGRLWVFGGGTPFTGQTLTGRSPFRLAPSVLAATHIYDPTSNSYSAGPPLTIPRNLLAGTSIGTTAYALGGYDGSYTDYDTVETSRNPPGACGTPVPSPTPCPLQFTDVDPGNPFYTYISCLVCRNIVSGYSASPPCTTGVPCFLPGATVTRGQVAKFVANAVGYSDPIPSTQQTFTDVPFSNPFWVYIERAALHGVISGYTSNPPCGSGVPCFLPGAPVTRGQTAKFVANAAGYADAIPGAQQTFTDLPSSNAFWVFVERAALHGVISGYTSNPPCGTGPPCFLGGAPVTRGQTAKFIANAFFPACQAVRR